MVWPEALLQGHGVYVATVALAGLPGRGWGPRGTAEVTPPPAAGGPGVCDAYLPERPRPLPESAITRPWLRSVRVTPASSHPWPSGRGVPPPRAVWCLAPGTVGQEPCSEVTGRCHHGVALLTHPPAWAPRQAHGHLGKPQQAGGGGRAPWSQFRASRRGRRQP